MNFIQLFIAFSVVLLSIIASYVRSRSKMATMEAQIKHQDGEIKSIIQKMDKMKDENRNSQEKLWQKLDVFNETLHRIELALVNKEDRK